MNRIIADKKFSINRITFLKFMFFFLFSFLFSVPVFSQDSIPVAKDLNEEKELKFQQFFFKALSEKSIGNFQKAIENLESCNQILANDAAVFFEFSKNYLKLNKTFLAKEYIERALAKEQENVWMLKHLIAIYTSTRDYEKAINIQQKLAITNPKENVFLVSLYLNNREFKKAISLMNTMEANKALPSNLKRIRIDLEQRNKNLMPVKNDTIKNSLSLQKQFETHKTFAILDQLLEVSKNNFDELLKYSIEGLNLFPAQPKVYLMQGKALNGKKKFKKALIALENGIDFVIEEKMEADYYNEMAKSYKGLGNLEEEKKYIEKSKKAKF